MRKVSHNAHRRRATRCSKIARNHEPLMTGYWHERTDPLRFVCGHRRSDGQLQHGGLLTFAQLRQQHDPPIRELKGVMMGI
jgi:hypothetical protein